MKQQPIGRTDTLKLNGVALFVPAVAGTLKTTSRSCNANGGAINKTNTPMERRTLTCDRMRVNWRTFSHQPCSPIRQEMTPLSKKLLHATAKTFAQSRGGPPKK